MYKYLSIYLRDEVVDIEILPPTPQFYLKNRLKIEEEKYQPQQQ